MVLRINPSKMPLWRSPTELQLGLGDDAPRLRDLTRAQERLIQMLYKGLPDEYLRNAADQLGVQNPEAIVEAVAPALLDVRIPQIDEHFVAEQFAEICRAQSTYGISGEAILANRSTRNVFVSKSENVHTALTESLTKSGVGAIIENYETPADFAILIANHTIAPRDYSHWLNAGVPHLAVIFDQRGVIITPVIQTGITPCLSCFHAGETERDSAWPELASQLLFSQQRFNDSTSQLFGSAIACMRALETIDALGTFEVQGRNRSGYRLDIPTGEVTEFEWKFSAACLCQQG